MTDDTPAMIRDRAIAEANDLRQVNAELRHMVSRMLIHIKSDDGLVIDAKKLLERKI